MVLAGSVVRAAQAKKNQETAASFVRRSRVRRRQQALRRAGKREEKIERVAIRMRQHVCPGNRSKEMLLTECRRSGKKNGKQASKAARAACSRAHASVVPAQTCAVILRLPPAWSGAC